MRMQFAGDVGAAHGQMSRAVPARWGPGGGARVVEGEVGRHRRYYCWPVGECWWEWEVGTKPARWSVTQ